MKLLNNLKLTDIKGQIINAKDVKVKIMQKILNKKSLPKYQDKWNNLYNEECIGHKCGLILKGWTSVIKLKNSKGNASITLFILKVDFENLTY